MHSFITHCPHCQTAFQISTAQLEAADGYVRCGVCLNVFVAADNFFDGAPTLQKKQTAEAAKAEAVLSGTAPQIESGYDAASDAGSEPGWELFEEDLPEAPLASEQLLREQEPVNTQKQILFEDNAERREPLLFTNRSSAFEIDLLDDNEAKQFSPTNRAALHECSEPVEIHSWQKNRVNLLKAAGGATLAILLIITLGLQLIWFKRSELSERAEWRPRIEWMCTQLPCMVAAQRDLTAISSENLVVRSHPDAENALLVSLNFRNDAVFAQPFPALTLKFTDIDQQQVGIRRFLPREYLQEELWEIALMPPNTSVQARVDIVDPGSNAINYEVFLGDPD